MENRYSMLPSGSSAMKIICAKLIELARECQKSIQSGNVTNNNFMELEDKLEKLLYETHSAYIPPVSKPQISDFDEIQHLSSGSFGSVDLVRHKKTGQSFAMKLICRNTLTTPQVHQLFVERDILTFAENPFITQMVCSFETTRNFGIVMEFVGGTDCDYALYTDKYFPVDRARLYVAETVMGLRYLHSLGIVHKDLKPANMLISSTGHIKLTDFGLSSIGPVNMTTDQRQESVTHIIREFTNDEVCGTPSYMAPEMLFGEGYGKPVDWWALGIILFQFLLGDVPFYGEDVDEQCIELLTQDLTWPEGEHNLTEDAKDLIVSLLNKNPEERLGTRGANTVKDHPFFYELDMNNLLSEVPLFIPGFEWKDNCCRNHRSLEYDDRQRDTHFSRVAFRFRKAYEEETFPTMKEMLRRWQKALMGRLTTTHPVANTRRRNM